MKIKSRVWHWLAVACGSVGLVLGMGAEGTTAVVLVLLGLLCMKLGFLAQDREEREGKGGRYGRITRNHARNDDYPHDKEMGA